MRRSFSFIASLALLATVTSAAAQSTASPPPPPDERPPVLGPVDDGLEPQVTILQREGDTIEEYRVNGKLYKIRVIPQRGEPYILIDQRGDGAFVRSDGPGTPGLSLPTWVIGTF